MGGDIRIPGVEYMPIFYLSLSGLEKVFFVCAAVSAFLFVIRMGLMILGGDDSGEVDLDADFDDMGHGFQLLTIHGLNAFSLMFGLVGLALSRQSGASAGWSIIGGLVAGMLTMAVFAKLMEMMLNLQSSGTVNVRNAVGRDGTVYLQIQAGGTGKVQLVVQNRLRIYDAKSEDKEQQIDTGEPIQVVEVIGANLLIVKKI
jgi:membrane protein implicated in regulation of membrane protease activity